MSDDRCPGCDGPITFSADDYGTMPDPNRPASVKASPADAGCWIDGHWGQYGVARMVKIAAAHGYDDAEVISLASRHLASMGSSDEPDLIDDEHESLMWAADEVEQWMTANVAPEGFYFHWHYGEFFLSSEDEDEDEDEDALSVEAFFNAYVKCALWSSVDEEDIPMDENYSPDDIARESLVEMRLDCLDFLTHHWADFRASGATAGQAGHDFWLTRNRHGAGFWDRGYGPVGNSLTAAAHAYGSSDLYVGDDGAIYVV